MNRIRLYIIEDHEFTLDSPLHDLKSFADIRLVGHARSAEEALLDIASMTKKPDVVICDLGLPKMSGITATKKLKESYKFIEVLIFTVFEEENKVLQAIRAGAAGYLLKGVSADKIHEAITEVYVGGTIIQPRIARKLLKYFSRPFDGLFFKGDQKKSLAEPMFMADAGLTIRELECLQMVGKGLSNQEVSAVLKLSRSTIRTHLEHIYQKLDVTNRVEAVTEGLRQGIIEI